MRFIVPSKPRIERNINLLANNAGKPSLQQSLLGSLPIPSAPVTVELVVTEDVIDYFQRGYGIKLTGIQRENFRTPVRVGPRIVIQKNLEIGNNHPENATRVKRTPTFREQLMRVMI